MNNFQKKIIGRIIEFLHIIGYFYLIIAPFFTKNIKLLLIIASIHATIIFLWYNTGDCILTPLENWCLDKKTETYKDGIQKSRIINILFGHKYEDLVKNIIMLIPIISIINNSYNIYKNCNTKKKN